VTAVIDDQQLLTKRRAALEVTGWGRPFTFLQPRNLAMWVYLALVASGTALWVQEMQTQSHVYSQAIVASTVVFGLYGALFWWFTARIDRYSSQSAKVKVVAFIWGGFGATWAMAAPANDAIRSLYAKAFGQVWALNWSAGLTAPFTEELSKGLGLLLILALGRKVVRTAYDGFIIGAFIGLGFQIVEDISYGMNSAASQFGANQVGAAMQTIYMRLAVGVAAHILYSATFCAGLLYLIGTPAQPRRVGRGLALMATSMLLHGVWDSVSGIVSALGVPGMSFVLLAGVIVLAILIVFWTFHLTVTPERQYMLDVMAPEVASGVITQAELDALSGTRKDRKAYWKSRSGHRDRKQAKHVLDASFDLADAIAADRGLNTPKVEFTRSEVRRLRQATS